MRPNFVKVIAVSFGLANEFTVKKLSFVQAEHVLDRIHDSHFAV
jgi:hypothetical protein